MKLKAAELEDTIEERTTKDNGELEDQDEKEDAEKGKH